ncbi:MAG TPA: tetratricopeptide repeat protein [Alphaproteobacteria bacterium]|nr:tetratricopeptide repeat protein [Alphaproteobacteria bacterium]
MSDIFREVDEELRRDEIGKLWKQYGAYIIGACVAIVLASAAIVAWRAYQGRVHRAASLAYENIVHSVARDTPALTEATAKALAEAEPKLTPGYRLLSMLQRAAVAVQAKKYTDAIALLDAVAKDPAAPKEMRAVALLKSSYLQAESLSLADMRARVESLAVPESAFRFSAEELLGYAAYRTGDLKSARDYFAAILSDPLAPRGVHERALSMAGLIAGKLPEPEVPSTDQNAKPQSQAKPTATH